MLQKLALIFSLGLATTVPAAEIVIDYSFAGDFFSPSTTDGQNARQTVEAAADFYSAILEDSLTAIQVPEPFVSPTNGTTTTFSWEARFSHPSAPGELTVTNPAVGEDVLRVYVGAQSLPGPTTAQAGFGRFFLPDDMVGPGYTGAELPQFFQVAGTFEDALRFRGQGANDFAAWGGSISFDTEITWNLDHTVEPTTGQNDLFSVAIHEIGHVLGVGGSDEWQAFVSPSFTFTGEETVAANGGLSPSVDDLRAHFAEGTTSVVYGETTPQEASYDPSQTLGQRKLFTELDAAALRDIGWSVVQSIIPEPTSIGLSLLAIGSLAAFRRR